MRSQTAIPVVLFTVLFGLALALGWIEVLGGSVAMANQQEMTGSVVWAETKEPVGGALVTPRAGKEELKATITGSDGEFVVPVGKADTLIVSVVKTTAGGFSAVDWMQEFKITERPLVLAIPRPKKVVVLSGEVVPASIGDSAELQVLSNTAPHIGQSTFADRQGRFQFMGLPAASYRLTVIAQNGVTVQVPQLVVPRKESLTVPLVSTSTNHFAQSQRPR